jgi:vacuolar-type H+-ATPase subunit H
LLIIEDIIGGGDMEDIIKELIQIESTADTLVNEVIEEQQNLDKLIQEQAESIRARINQRTLENINEMYETARQESSQKIEEINHKSQLWSYYLEESYKKNRGKWEEELINKIIGQ